jgi:Esterase/lipase
MIAEIRILMRCLIIILLALIFSGGKAQIIRKKNIAYIPATVKGFHANQNLLDVYYPVDTTSKKDVLIFIHGGSWGSGTKNTYRLMGKSLAKKGIVAVIINYRLAPEVQYQAMALDCAKSVVWVYQNISRYGGDPEKITLAGHSAGGHLSALITLKDYFEKLKMQNPVRQVILIDPFGLDMVSYFNEYNNHYSRSLFKVFTSNPEQWKVASPLYDVTSGIQTPFLILAGARTYRVIQLQSQTFYDRLKQENATVEMHLLKRKKHIGMITQFFRPHHKNYSLLINFIQSKKNSIVMK